MHKMSNLVLLTKGIPEGSIVFLENTLELVAVKKQDFENQVTNYLKAYTRKNAMITQYNKQQLAKVSFIKDSEVVDNKKYFEEEKIDPFKLKHKEYQDNIFLPIKTDPQDLLNYLNNYDHLKEKLTM
jgi:hypothetical protein